MNSKLTLMISVGLSIFLLTPASRGAEKPPTQKPAGSILSRASVSAAMAAIRPQAIRAHMGFLADDLLAGRGTATRGYDVAARYVAAQFAAMGLKPAGDDHSFLQYVPFRTAHADESKSTLSLTATGDKGSKSPIALKYREDFLLRGDFGRQSVAVTAPVVFVGYGITAPSEHYDDYEHIDAKGKIVALIFGAPKFDSALKAHYTSSLQKIKNAIAHGAVGMIVVDDPVLEGLYPFSKRVRDLRTPDFRWLDPQGAAHNFFPQIKGVAQLNVDATRRLFDGAAYSAEQVFEAAKSGRPPAFDLPLIATIETVTQSREVRSPNILATLEGSDPGLAHEHVVYSAHLDHLGVSESAAGDGIYNGALDNASGIAIMLETARVLSQMNPRPRRSILFLAVTAEEDGLLGSDYFANNPTVDKRSIVANVNVDEDKMLWPVRDVVVYGADHSSLGRVVQAAATRLQLAVSPDPEPEQVIFVRSDQYSFVQQGVPSIMPNPGFKSLDPAIDPHALSEKWEKTRYHEVGDDMSQPGLDFESAATFARFVYLCGYLIAEETQRPTWNPGDFFGIQYAPKSP